jgi:hypothetical protein
VIDFLGYNKDDEFGSLFFSKMGAKIGPIGDWFDIESQRIYWWTVVKEFTSRDLTEITDRLPAMSGIMTKLQERTGDAPIAGLWKNDLPYGLLWQCASRAMKRPQALSKIPTWS